MRMFRLAGRGMAGLAAGLAAPLAMLWLAGLEPRGTAAMRAMVEREAAVAKQVMAERLPAGRPATNYTQYLASPNGPVFRLSSFRSKSRRALPGEPALFGFAADFDPMLEQLAREIVAADRDAGVPSAPPTPAQLDAAELAILSGAPADGVGLAAIRRAFDRGENELAEEILRAAVQRESESLIESWALQWWTRWSYWTAFLLELHDAGYLRPEVMRELRTTMEASLPSDAEHEAILRWRFGTAFLEPRPVGLVERASTAAGLRQSMVVLEGGDPNLANRQEKLLRHLMPNRPQGSASPGDYYQPHPEARRLVPWLPSRRGVATGDMDRAIFLLAALEFHAVKGRWPADDRELVPDYLTQDLAERTVSRWMVLPWPEVQVAYGDDGMQPTFSIDPAMGDPFAGGTFAATTWPPGTVQCNGPRLVFLRITGVSSIETLDQMRKPSGALRRALEAEAAQGPPSFALQAFWLIAQPPPLPPGTTTVVRGRGVSTEFLP